MAKSIADLFKTPDGGPSPLAMGLLQMGAQMMQAGAPSKDPASGSFGGVLGAGFQGLAGGMNQGYGMQQDSMMMNIQRQRAKQMLADSSPHLVKTQSVMKPDGNIGMVGVFSDGSVKEYAHNLPNDLQYLDNGQGFYPAFKKGLPGNIPQAGGQPPIIDNTGVPYTEQDRQLIQGDLAPQPVLKKQPSPDKLLDINPDVRGRVKYAESYGSSQGELPAKKDLKTFETGLTENKPMPPAALKMQQDDLDAIGAAANNQANLTRFRDLIATGKLNLGFLANLASKARTATNMSNEESRNYNSLISNLETLRNNSLRLNNGVQTEGDAQRAWNELITNLNDEETVKQRLDEIILLNDRAKTLKMLNVDVIRENYKQPPMDYSPYSETKPAVGNGASGGLEEKPNRRETDKPNSELESLRRKHYGP